MSNKVLSSLLVGSFIVIIAGLFTTGTFESFLYGMGAIGTIVFGGLTLSRLYQIDNETWIPYMGGAVMVSFWSFVFIAPEGIGILSPLYFVTLLYAALKLYRRDRFLNDPL